MRAKFRPRDLRAGVDRLERLFGAGAVEEARRQARRYNRHTWGAQWWSALLRELEQRAQAGLSPHPGASIDRCEGSGWIATGEFLERA